MLPYKCWKTVIKHFLIIKSFETGTFAESHSTTSWTSGEGSGPRSSQGNPESDQNQKPGMDSNNKCYKVEQYVTQTSDFQKNNSFKIGWHICL